MSPFSSLLKWTSLVLLSSFVLAAPTPPTPMEQEEGNIHGMVKADATEAEIAAPQFTHQSQPLLPAKAPVPSLTYKVDGKSAIESAEAAALTPSKEPRQGKLQGANLPAALGLPDELTGLGGLTSLGPIGGIGDGLIKRTHIL